MADIAVDSRTFPAGTIIELMPDSVHRITNEMIVDNAVNWAALTRGRSQI